MSDFNSSLPTKTENRGDIQVIVVDTTVTSQGMSVDATGKVSAKLSDGNGNEITSQANGAQQALDVGINVGGVQIDPRDIRPLTSADVVTVESNNLDIRDLVFATDKVDVTGSDVTVSNTVTVQSVDLDIRDLTHVSDSIKIGDGTDFLAVNADGSINVVISDSTPGTAVNDYNTVAAVAGGATSTHTYTSTGNFNLTQIEASGSGKIKIEVQVNGTTRFVQFSSSSDPNLSIIVTQPILATTGQTVTVIRTNRENQAQDVYSTISGYLA